MPAITTTSNGLSATTSKFAWVRKFGHALVKLVEIEIGGSRIDRQFGHWLDVWYELTHTAEQERGYKKMIGDEEKNTTLEGVREDGVTFKDEFTVYVPFRFWWNRIIGLALPLIALQYHEVRLNIDFEDASKLYLYSGAAAPTNIQIADAIVLVDYVYLDVNERRRFAQVGHEYLIEQLQHTGPEVITTTTGNSTVSKTKLNFNHPCKELIWDIRGGNYISGTHKFLTYTPKDDWSTALDEAAVRVFDGACYLKDTSAPAADTQTGTADINITLDGTHYTNSTTGTIGNSQHLLTSVLLVDGLTIDTGTGRGIALPSDATTAVRWLTMKKNVLIDSVLHYSLLDKIDSVTIVVGLTGGVLAANIAIQQITVESHDLTIRDISIPMENLTSGRRTGAETGDEARVFSVGLATDDVTIRQHFNYGLLIDGTGNPIERGIIQLNGHDRFKEREGAYFNYVQPWQHHTHTPADGINVYSFGLNPEEHQPSGTANLSRIDNTQLNLTLRDFTAYIGSTIVFPSLNFFNNDTLLWIYATNYNVLRILAGMGGLAYSS